MHGPSMVCLLPHRKQGNINSSAMLLTAFTDVCILATPDGVSQDSITLRVIIVLVLKTFSINGLQRIPLYFSLLFSP